MYDQMLLQCSAFALLPMDTDFPVIDVYYTQIRTLVWHHLEQAEDPEAFRQAWHEININAKADLLLLERLHLGEPLYEQTLRHMQGVVVAALNNIPKDIRR
ncbi:hypothetical protein SAMN05216167_14419 [Spirosoma endophyticum]|uniref:Uncharacterized protein n=2 Tax=Spirosoma endophyticum TaxID=662367 RepID=A0A1I2HJH5_9BACT|nr:hypothetical protein SAMN05216167_14419 [Spirosoma endophyticum]